MNEHAVLIAGGGSTGLMLAGELALAGVDVAIVERRPNRGRFSFEVLDVGTTRSGCDTHPHRPAGRRGGRLGSNARLMSHPRAC
jgi:glycine/D-amino acid oxidase-like deaminating enzyme